MSFHVAMMGSCLTYLIRYVVIEMSSICGVTQVWLVRCFLLVKICRWIVSTNVTEHSKVRLTVPIDVPEPGMRLDLIGIIELQAKPRCFDSTTASIVIYTIQCK